MQGAEDVRTAQRGPDGPDRTSDAPSSAPRRSISVEISVGELIDKITILEIKAERIRDETKLQHVRAELAGLNATAAAVVDDADEIKASTRELKRLNQRIWDAVDAIHRHEAADDFGREFIAVARSIYLDNDLRAEVKRKLNILAGSAIHEQKHYSTDSPA